MSGGEVGRVPEREEASNAVDVDASSPGTEPLYTSRLPLIPLPALPPVLLAPPPMLAISSQTALDLVHSAAQTQIAFRRPRCLVCSKERQLSGRWITESGLRVDPSLQNCMLVNKLLAAS